jgi:hypothetical protein
MFETIFQKTFANFGYTHALRGYTTFEGVYIRAQKQDDFQDNPNTRTLAW